MNFPSPRRSARLRPAALMRSAEEMIDGRKVRGALRYGATGLLAWSLFAAYANGGQYTVAASMVFIVPALFLLALVAKRWRAEVLAVAAALVCVGTSDSFMLWPAAIALVYMSAAFDTRRLPWPAVAAGLGGSITSSFVFSSSAPQAPYFAALAGLALAMLVRSLDRLATQTDVLSRSTRELRGQTRWLEQRTALARELHDVVGHHVTAMVVQAEAGQVRDPQAALRAIADAGRVALGELDQLVVHLRDPDSTISVTAPPRLSDIEELLAEPLRQHGVEVHVHVDTDLGLDELGILTVYRITQEALTNVARHAQASATWIELVRSPSSDEPGRVRLRVADDGVGPPQDARRGSGLLGIDERVQARRGSWDMSGRPGGGTIVDVRLPSVVST